METFEKNFFNNLKDGQCRIVHWMTISINVRYNISSYILNMSTNPCTRNSIFNIIMLSYLCFWSTSEWNLLCWLHCICLECFHCIMWVCKMVNTNFFRLGIGVPTHISVVVAFMYPLQPSNTYSFMLPTLKYMLQ